MKTLLQNKIQFYIIPFVLGTITSFSLPPYNFFFLNFKFRNKNKTTDVLSFPLKYTKNKKTYIGDIAISYEIINQRSKLSNFFMEFDKIWIHGFLHLIGYDHKKLKDFKKMSKKENLVLNYFHK